MELLLEEVKEITYSEERNRNKSKKLDKAGWFSALFLRRYSYNFKSFLVS